VIADVAAAMAALRRDVAFDCDVAAELAVAVDTHDLSEIVGNLLDNAGRHARARVTMRAAATGGGVAVTIDDDGPGIPADRREAAMRPGVRLDEGPAGDGFGLSIVRDLLALHHGGLTLDRAPAGGLRVIATLPAAG
jgi:signal transduction histidine kinase